MTQPTNLYKYIDWKFFELLDIASNHDLDNITVGSGYVTREAEELKRFIKSIYEKGFEDGVKQNLNL